MLTLLFDCPQSLKKHLAHVLESLKFLRVNDQFRPAKDSAGQSGEGGPHLPHLSALALANPLGEPVASCDSF